MSTKTEDVEAAMAVLHEIDRGFSSASNDDELIEGEGLTVGMVRTLLASHAALSADLATAEDALVSQTALVRSQAERIASLEAGITRLCSVLRPGMIRWEGVDIGKELAALLSGKDSA